jgi:DNA-binding SARP family transcriptional activator
MAKGGAKPGWPVDRTFDWRKASELIQAGQYEQVAEILREAQAASEQVGDEVLAGTLAAACQICLACSQYRAQVEWHQQVCEDADQRERDLRHRLRAILDLANHRIPPSMPGEPEEASSVPAFETSSHKVDRPKPVAHPSLGQRVRAVLSWRLGQHRPKREIAATSPKGKQKERLPPSLAIHCLGPFQVYQDDRPITDWPSSKGKSVFKYLVAHRERPAAKEVLMELFWPNTHPDAARNNLNVAIYGLRQALRQARPLFSHVLFQDDCYLLNPDLQVWVDCEAFMEHLTTAQALERRGALAAAMHEYHKTEALYQGEFLEEDRYEDWPIPQRQRFQDDYLHTLDRLSHYYLDQPDYAACATACSKMLAADACCEEAHRRLMRCYSRQGQPYLAVRQYHMCVEALNTELDVVPTLITRTLYERILKGKRV